jgi:energy-coupling factor transporter ATP-binding protein EcfA2
MESIDSLAKAINKFEGGMVLVSHDMRLISQVAREIWVVDNNTVMKYVGEIADFKMQIRAQMQKNNLMQGSDAVTNAKAPILVPLAPRAGITTVTGVAPPVAAVAPPVSHPTAFLLSLLISLHFHRLLQV